MATAFEPRTSFRGSQTRPPGTSAADTLPDVDFGFEDLRKRMVSFTSRFDDFIAEGRKNVLAERNEHRSRLAELQGELHTTSHFCADILLLLNRALEFTPSAVHPCPHH